MYSIIFSYMNNKVKCEPTKHLSFEALRLEVVAASRSKAGFLHATQRPLLLLRE